MQRSFLSNLAFLIFLNLLVKPFWILGIDRKVQNILGSEVYGEYFILFNLSVILNIILDLGITNYNNRNVAQNRKELTKNLPAMVVVKLGLGLVYIGILFIGAFLLNYSDFRLQLLGLLAFNQFLISLTLYFRSNIAALQFFKLDALISVLDKLMMIFFCALLIWGDVLAIPFSITHFVYAQTAAYMITLLFAVIGVLPHTRQMNLKVDMSQVINVLKKSYPYAVLVLLMYIYHRMDAVMLDWLLEDGSFESGIYAQGYRLLDAFNMLTILPVSILYPLFSKMIGEKKSVNSIAGTSFGLLFSITSIVSICCWWYADEIMNLLYSGIADNSSTVFKYLIIASVPIATGYVTGTLLTANGNLKQLNVIAISGVFINFILNYLLIPSFGAEGSAIATLITQLTTIIAQVFIAKLVFSFTFPGDRIVRYILFLLLILTMAWSIDHLSLNWIWKCIINLLILPFLAILTGILKIKAVIGLMRYDED